MLSMQSSNIHRVIKVGKSLAVILPAHLARAVQFERGDAVAFSCVEENEMRVRKLNEQTLRDLRLGFIK